MLRSPVNRLGLGLVTLTGISALIFFLLHIITHAWGGEIEREDSGGTGRYGCSHSFKALPGRGSEPRIGDPCGMWEMGRRRRGGRVRGWDGDRHRTLFGFFFGAFATQGGRRRWMEPTLHLLQLLSPSAGQNLAH